jgi:hypothetical protein
MTDALAAYIASVPASARQMMTRALSGKSKSPRDGIRTMCLACSGFARDEAAACTVWRCPLFYLNPYRQERGYGP